MRDRSLLIMIMLLALAPVWPVHAVDLSALHDSKGIPTSFGLQVLEAFHGKDLRGKDGPLHKLGMDLIVTFRAFEEFQARGGQQHTGKPFEPADPLVRVHDERVVLDAVAMGAVEILRRDLVKLGMQQPAVFGRMVSGTLPVRALGKVATLGSLHRARPAMARTRAGSVTSQGDAAMNAAAARSTFGVDGSGVMVGTLSDSYDCTSGGGGATGDVSSGDPPRYRQ